MKPQGFLNEVPAFPQLPMSDCCFLPTEVYRVSPLALANTFADTPSQSFELHGTWPIFTDPSMIATFKHTKMPLKLQALVEPRYLNTSPTPVPPSPLHL